MSDRTAQLNELVGNCPNCGGEKQDGECVACKEEWGDNWPDRV